ncbi:FAD binding domain-containing protein [Gluconacetobacter tumulisoli]|uniref:Carbon monoxide dehydrogenase n=1 Tax=Gluconacetobacter tumulisoli TaxID=1286189 RepID=A0A7W4PKL1_9PROT|nr:FAD binding domain-containing protein [Gluconacetobacter tumulisoli]MBB2201502.1 carbon monoxide dehydrogenase [Gluconacetobacter tumulisoli]
MKPVAFDHDCPVTLEEAARLIARPGARPIAGGQSLGPMLNFRVARPDHLVALAALAGLTGVEDTAQVITLGAATCHAAIEDGRVPDLPGGVLSRIAGGIAYRAVRNRGTIGGSLCHADPGADWLITLTALDASVLTWTPSGGRMIPLAGFVTGAFRTVLAAGEIVQAVHIPRPGPGFGWGYVKACRKPGEFAHAMAALLVDPARGVRRLVIGATGGAPVLLQGVRADPACVGDALAGSGLGRVERRMQAVVAARALAQATNGRVMPA